MNSFFFLLAVAAFAFFAMRRLRRYLHLFQQDDYNTLRFIEWMIRTRAFDKRLSLALLLVAVIALLDLTLWARLMMVAALLAGFALYEPDPRRAGKKKLAMTPRAQRIFYLALGLSAVIGLGAAASRWTLAWIFAVQALPLLLCLAKELLKPVEARVQQNYWNEAEARLKRIAPTVIGITGSFGKTSVKHMLGHVLEMHARTYFTPGSVNTPMGIARMIREKLPVDCKYFLVEMGAYGPGSIERLCRLTPPDFGVLTAIGDAHYERYKSLDAVARTKFELPQAVLATPAGKTIIHESALEQLYAREFFKAHRDRFLVVGAGEGAALHIGTVEQTREGLHVEVQWQGETHRLFAPLFGAHHADNLAVVFASAVALGLAPERVIAAMRTIPQIKHRLEVKPQADGSIIIDDAFNSNQRGFASALELLSLLSDGARRVLITPGVAELGARNDTVHGELGAFAAKHVDVALIVRSDRIPAFAENFRRAGGAALHECASLAEAQNWLRAHPAPRDIILYENDLPDLLERRLSL